MIESEDRSRSSTLSVVIEQIKHAELIFPNNLKFLDKMISRVSTFFRQHPMLKGMAVYAVIWPTSSVVQQVINKEDLDWRKSLRFFMFGTFFVAPTLFGWIKLTSHMWPTMSLKTGITKAVVEQFSYGPAAGVAFFTLMTLMEGRGFDDVKSELTEKFPKTYRGKKISCKSEL